MKEKKVLFAAAAVMAVMTIMTGCQKKSLLDKNDPVTIKVWHYYTGEQQAAFDELVDEFNLTEGKEKGIFVEGQSQGSVSDLSRNISDSISGKAGAEELPDIFAGYPDMVYMADKEGCVADLSGYFSGEELEEFVDGYLQEGYMGDGDVLKSIPVAKSVELFSLNKTDWDKFARETGAEIETLESVEGIVKTAEAYYEWSGGKAFFGRDSMANYMIIGYRQLAGDIFKVENGKASLSFDRDVVKTLWDNYYVPYVKGYFASVGRFRSDDIKMGDILCYVGSSSGAIYMPQEVVLSDDESYPIEMITMPGPEFENGEAYAVQQGAGMAVTNGNKKSILASVEFLKWFTQDKQNIRFAVASGYLPVKKSASNLDVITKNVEMSGTVAQAIESSLETISENNMYAVKGFENATDVRNLLGDAMEICAQQDREKVEENMAAGMTLEEAAAPFLQETYFDGWYESVKAKLEEMLD